MSNESDRPDEANVDQDCRNEDVGEGKGLTVSRRLFLSYGGVAVTAATLPVAWGCNPDGSPNGQISLGGEDEDLNLDNLFVSFTLTVQRREDLVNLTFGFVGFNRAAPEAPQATRISTPGLIVVGFPAQHVLERAFLETLQTPAVDPPTAPPVGSRIAYGSRLVFAIPDEVNSISLTTEDLLGLMRQYGLNVSSRATPPANVALPNLKRAPGTSLGEPHSGAPHALETSIELPFRVQISPSIYGRWAHATSAKSARDRYELWHTRLGVVDANGTGTDEKNRALRMTRAIYAREVDPNNKNDTDLFGIPEGSTPLGRSLSQVQRRQLVQESSDPALTDTAGKPLTPAPMRVNRLMLSALGGWLDSELTGSSNTISGVEHWVHRASQGRDHFVQVVISGWLYPFGVRAAYVQETERRFSSNNASGIPYLYQRNYLIFREQHRDYPLDHTNPDIAKMMRMMPFSAIDIIPKSSPILDSNATPDAPFLVSVAGAPWSLPMIATDRAGNRVRYAPKVVWLPNKSPGVIYDNFQPPIKQLYTGNVGLTQMDGQRIACVPERTKDETALEAVAIVNYGQFFPLTSSDLPQLRVPFYPVMLAGQFNIEALRHVAGVEGATNVTWHSLYQTGGFNNNPRQLYFQISSTPASVNFSKQSDRAGGFLTPNLTIDGLSRVAGPSTNSASPPSDGSIDPKALFPSPGGDDLAALTPKIFGCIPLSSIIKGDSFESAAPRFITEALNDAERFVATLTRLRDGLLRVAHPLPALPGGSSLAAHRQAIVDQVAILIDQNQIQSSLNNIASKKLDQVLPKPFTDALGALSTLLDKPETGKMSLQMPGMDAALRDLARYARDVAALLGTVSSALKALFDGAELVKDMQVQLEWRPKIKSFGEIFIPNREDGLTLSAVVRAKDAKGKPAGVDMVCSLEDFKLQLMGPVKFITIPFKRLQFRQQSGKKPEIDVVLGDEGLSFGGPLSFIQTLKDIIPLDAFSDPPNISITPEGLQAGVSLALPDLAIGMFSLQNIAFGAMLKVPFLGDSLTFRFNFCTRENPFLLTVSALGGGGFFALDLSPQGVTALEVQFEFGACVAINLGVAKGSVSLMAGIYFGLQKVQNDTTCTLRGFLCLRGEMSILGMVSMNIEMRMELEWRDGKVIGRAVLEVEVSVLFFSASVSIEIERKFAGSNGDPTFEDLMKPYELNGQKHEPWLDYCEAFAA